MYYKINVDDVNGEANELVVTDRLKLEMLDFHFVDVIIFSMYSCVICKLLLLLSFYTLLYWNLQLAKKNMKLEISLIRYLAIFVTQFNK